jgi:predicted phage terminase large subunit-like protein
VKLVRHPAIAKITGSNAPIDLEAELFKVRKRKCELSLAFFIKEAWSIIEPGQPYIHGWHIDFICAHLEAITRGEVLEDGTPYNRLLVNVPPGTMKSLLIGVFWPAWEWGPQNMPHMRYVCASHSQDLAVRDGLRMRRLIQSEWYQKRWGDRVQLTGDQNQKIKFENTETGFRQAAAAGSITGSRGDRVIIDDPLSVDDAGSDAVRNSTNTWFLEAVPTRLNNPKTSAIIVIMQRLHEEDVSGIILEKQLGYDHIMLPMRYDPSRAAPTALGYEDPREIDGELLFPQRFPVEVVDRDERAMGPYACNPGEAPVLMADLSLRRIDQVRAGDKILGWERVDGRRSSMVETTIKQVFKYHAPVVKMTLDSGDVIRCTPDHKWWRARWEKGRKEYGPASVGTALARVCPSKLSELSQEEQRLAGWLSGFYDGEGTVSVCKKNGAGDYKPSYQIHFYQGSGRNLPLCEKLERALTHFGFNFSYSEDVRKPNKDAPCYGYRDYTLTSGQQSLGLAQRFLHIVQPTKWRDRIEKMALGAKFVKNWEKVVSIEPDGEEDVYALETGTGNYVVWGLASSNSAGQFQQTPEPRGGGIIKREWWQLWEHDVFPPMDYIIASLDTAYTEKTENDMSALTVWGIFSNDMIAKPTKMVSRNGTLYEAAINEGRSYAEQHPKLVLISAWAVRLPLHELVSKVAATCKSMRVDLLLIEAKASGISVSQELRRLYGNEDWGVQMINPGAQDKMARLYSVQHLFAEGMVYAPDRAWADQVITQCAQFPRAKHDDIVDTVSQALRHLRTAGLLTRSAEHLQQIEEGSRVKNTLKPLYDV